MRLSGDSENVSGGPVAEYAMARIALVLLTLFYIGWFTYHSYDRWYLLNCSWIDFGNIDSAAYNTAHGAFMRSNSRLYNYWSDHISPVLLVLSAYYVFGDGHLFIFLWQSACIGLAAVPLFLIARHFLRNEWLAFLIAASYLANGKIHMGNLYDYHMYSHVGLFAMSAFYAMLKKRWGWYFFFGALTMFVKEDTSVIFFMFGFYAAIVQREFSRAALTWAAAGAYALIVFKIGFPYFRGSYPGSVGDPSSYMYADTYYWLGASPLEIVKNFVTDPAKMIGMLMEEPERVKRWSWMAVQYGFLPFLSPIGTLILFFPSIELILQNRPGPFGLYFHYPLLVVPLWTLASVMALSNIRRWAIALGVDGTAGGAMAVVMNGLKLLSGAVVFFCLAAIVYFETVGPFDFTLFGQRVIMRDAKNDICLIIAAIVILMTVTRSSAIGRSLGELISTRIVAALALYLVIVNIYMSKDYGAPPILTDPAGYFSAEQREHAEEAWKILRAIPKDAVVAANEGAYTALNHNVNAYLFRGSGEFPFAEREVEYVALDTMTIKKAHRHPMKMASLEFMLKKDYGILEERDGFFLFKRGAPKKADYRHYLDNILTFSAWRLPGGVGAVAPAREAPEGKARKAFAGKTPEGCLLFGNYAWLRKGEYTAVFTLKVSENVPETVASIDVTGEDGKIVMAERKLAGADFGGAGRWSEIRLPFTVDRETMNHVELRVHYKGGADVSVSGTRIDMPFEEFLAQMAD